MTAIDVQLRTSYFDDTGCDIAPKCLSCPLPVCRYDDPVKSNVRQIETRDKLIIAFVEGELARGKVRSVSQAYARAALEFGLSARRVNAIFVERQTRQAAELPTAPSVKREFKLASPPRLVAWGAAE